METMLIDAAMAHYGPQLGVVAAASFGATRVVKAQWPGAPAWALRLLSVGVGAASGLASWGDATGAATGAVAGLASTAIVAAMRARASDRAPR
jgi:hypothetical protein